MATYLETSNTNTSSFNTSLEILPNEIFFSVLLYLNQFDIVRAFFNHNQRINSIVRESIRSLNVWKNTELSWFLEHMPYIGTEIEIITCNIGSVLNLFSSMYSYSKLHTVNLCSDQFRVTLNVKNDSPLSIIISCLNILRFCGIWLENDFNEMVRIIPTKKITPCENIQSISLRIDDEQKWVHLCNFAPNLKDIHINHYDFVDDVQIRHHAMINPDTKLSYLTRLHVDFDGYDTDFVGIQWLIASCHSTLQYFQLTSEFSSSINGRFLEELLHPCSNLKNLSFFLRTDQISCSNAVEQLHQFQSKWWLDENRPQVLVHYHRESFFIITSIPCTYKADMIQLPMDTNLWLVNKGNIDPSFFYFTKIVSVEFSNSIQQPVTLEFLYFINSIFRSGIENLLFDYWGFSSAHTLFKSVSLYV